MVTSISTSSSRSSSPPSNTNPNTTPKASSSHHHHNVSTTSTLRSSSAFSFYNNSSTTPNHNNTSSNCCSTNSSPKSSISSSNKKKRPNKLTFSQQNSTTSLYSMKASFSDDGGDEFGSMVGYFNDQSTTATSSSPSPLLLPLSSKFKSQKLLNTNTPQYQSTLKDIKSLKNQAPTKETLRRVAQEIKDKKIISKIAQLHLDVVEKRRKEAREQELTFSEFGATGKVATDDDGQDEALEFIEQVVKRLSEHLEFTKVELFHKVDIITTNDEDNFVNNFKKSVLDPLLEKQLLTTKPNTTTNTSAANGNGNAVNGSHGGIIKTDEEIQRFFDERINLVFKFWQQEFVLRLKSSLQLKREQEMHESNKENQFVDSKNWIGIDKYRKLQQENQVLNSLIEKRDQTMEEQRTDYFKEILCLKEELTKLNYQYVPPSYFPENFDAVLTLSFLEDENIKQLNQILLQTKTALDGRVNEIRNLLNSINLFQADTFEKLKKNYVTSNTTAANSTTTTTGSGSTATTATNNQSLLIEQLMETATVFKFKAQKLYEDSEDTIPREKYQSLLEKAIQLEKDNDRIQNELHSLQNIQRAQAILSREEILSSSKTTNHDLLSQTTPSSSHSVSSNNNNLNKTGGSSMYEENGGGGDEDDDDEDDTLSVNSYSATNQATPNNNNNTAVAVGGGVVDHTAAVISQLKKQLRAKDKRLSKLTIQLDAAHSKIKDFEDPEKIKESIMKPLRKYKAYRELIVALETEAFIMQKDLDKAFMREDALTRTKNNLLFKVEDLNTRLRQMNEEFQRNYVDKIQEHVNQIERMKLTMLDKEQLATNRELHIRELSTENTTLHTEISTLVSKISSMREEISTLEDELEEERSKTPPPPPPLPTVVEKQVPTIIEKVVEKYIPTTAVVIEKSHVGVQTDLSKTELPTSALQDIEISCNQTTTTSNAVKVVSNNNSNSSSKTNNNNTKQDTSRNSVSSSTTNSTTITPSKTSDDKQSNQHASSNKTNNNSSSTNRLPIGSNNNDTKSSTSSPSVSPQQEKTKSNAEANETTTTLDNEKPPLSTVENPSQSTTNGTTSTNGITTSPQQQNSIEIDNDPDYDFQKFKEEARIREEQQQLREAAEASNKQKTTTSRSNSRNNNSRTNSRAGGSRASSRNSTRSSTPTLPLTPTANNAAAEVVLSEAEVISQTTSTTNEKDTSSAALLLDTTSSDGGDEMINSSSEDHNNPSPTEKRQLHRLASLEFSRGDNDIYQMIHQARRKTMEEAEAAKLLASTTASTTTSEQQLQMMRKLSLSGGDTIVEEEVNASIESPHYTDEHTQMIKPERKVVTFASMLDDNNVDIRMIRPRRRIGTMTLIERLLISSEGKELREHGYNDYFYDEHGNLVLKKGQQTSSAGTTASTGAGSGASVGGENNKPTTTKLSVVISKNRKSNNNNENSSSNNYHSYKMDEEITEEFVKRMKPSHPLYRKFYDNDGNLLNDFNNPNNDFLNNNQSKSSPLITPSFTGRNNAHGFSNNIKRNQQRILEHGNNSDSLGDLFIGKNPTTNSGDNVIHSKTLLSDGSCNTKNNTRRSNSSNSNNRPNSSNSASSPTAAALTITTPTLFKSLGQHIELSNNAKQRRLVSIMKEEQDRLEKVLTSWNQMSRGHPDSILKMKEELLQQLEEEEEQFVVSYYDLKQQTRALSPPTTTTNANKKKSVDSSSATTFEREFNTIKYTPSTAGGGASGGNGVLAELYSELSQHLLNESKVQGLSDDSDGDGNNGAATSGGDNDDNSGDEEVDYEAISSAQEYLMRPLLKIKGYQSPTRSRSSSSHSSSNRKHSPPTQRANSANSASLTTDDSLLYDIHTLGQLDKLNTSISNTSAIATTNNANANGGGVMNIGSINLINIHERHSFNSSSGSMMMMSTPSTSVSSNQHLVSAPVIPKFGVKGRSTTNNRVGSSTSSTATTATTLQNEMLLNSTTTSAPVSLASSIASSSLIHRIPSIAAGRSRSVASIDSNDKPRPATTSGATISSTTTRNRSSFRSESAMDTLESSSTPLHSKKSIKR